MIVVVIAVAVALLATPGILGWRTWRAATASPSWRGSPQRVAMLLLIGSYAVALASIFMPELSATTIALAET